MPKRKKCYPLSFQILGGHNSTRALKSTPFKNPGRVARTWRRSSWRSSSRTALPLSNIEFLWQLPGPVEFPGDLKLHDELWPVLASMFLNPSDVKTCVSTSYSLPGFLQGLLTRPLREIYTLRREGFSSQKWGPVSRCHHLLDIGSNAFFNVIKWLQLLKVEILKTSRCDIGSQDHPEHGPHIWKLAWRHLNPYCSTGTPEIPGRLCLCELAQ